MGSQRKEKDMKALLAAVVFLLTLLSTHTMAADLPSLVEISNAANSVTAPKNSSKSDLYWMTMNIYYEAGVEPENGKYAVAQVTLNRLRTRQWGDSICSVVYSKAQFSWTLKKKLHKPQGDAWLESRWVAHTVLAQNIRVAPLQDATYYHADYVNPKWAKTVAKIQQVGTHIFYKKT